MGKLTSITGGGQKSLYNGSGADERDQALDAVQHYALQTLIVAWEARHSGQKVKTINLYKDDDDVWTTVVETEGDR